MRRASVSRIIITVVLMLWTPWCFCRVGGMSCCSPSTERDEATQSTESGSCCAGPSTNDDCCKHADESQPKAPTHGQCRSVCCAPKLPTPTWAPVIPCDTVGCDLPHTLFVELAPASDETPRMPAPPHWPPGKTCGRDVLLLSSILRT